jgi:transcriptional regulator with XRE-family HTH domain
VDHHAEFEEYKRIKGMVTSKELVAFRKANGLTATGFSRALGLGDKTITRLESGDIQSESVDMLLKYAMGRAKPLTRANSQKAKSGSLLAA